VHGRAYLRIKTDSLRADYSVYIMPVEPCRMVVYTSDRCLRLGSYGSVF
jgi:hypothetical protein